MIESLSCVVPAYNEARNIEGVVRDLLRAARRVAPRAHEVIVVDDGSVDGTGDVIDALARAEPSVRALHHPENRGVAAATRDGLVAARHDWILYVDGDGQFDAADLDRLAPLAAAADVVAGVRAERADPAHRRLNAALYNRLLRLLFRLPVRDVNCAFKLLRRERLPTLDCRSDSAFFLAELLIRADRAGLRFAEAPVTHRPRRFETPSGARPSVVVPALVDAVCCRFRWGAWR